MLYTLVSSKTVYAKNRRINNCMLIKCHIRIQSCERFAHCKRTIKKGHGPWIGKRPGPWKFTVMLGIVEHYDCVAPRKKQYNSGLVLEKEHVFCLIYKANEYSMI